MLAIERKGEKTQKNSSYLFTRSLFAMKHLSHKTTHSFPYAYAHCVILFSPTQKAKFSLSHFFCTPVFTRASVSFRRHTHTHLLSTLTSTFASTHWYKSIFEPSMNHPSRQEERREEERGLKIFLPVKRVAPPSDFPSNYFSALADL